jgi:exosortase
VKKPPVPLILGGLAFAFLFWQPLVTLGRDWWSDPDAGHGLLLFPIAVWLAWKRGLVAERRPAEVLGLVVLGGAVLLRYLSGLAAELLTMRLSLVGAVLGLILYAYGWRQLVRWWLPLALVLLSIPLPDVVVGTLALPLQLKASEWGAALLDLRHVPVRLAGNVIYLPGRSLFVTEACSGLRSLTSLIALGVLIGGLWMRSPWNRGLLVLLAIPVAMVLNAIRIFLTGFLVYYVNPELAEGVMHLTEGWALFVVAFAILGAIAWVLTGVERLLVERRAARGAAAEGA